MKGTLTSRDDIERLFREGRRSSCAYASISALPVSGRPGGCVYAAGKKLGSAPLRSRCKRVMRECARELGAPWPGHDVALVARRSIADAPHDEVVSQMRRTLEKLSVI